MGMLESFCGLVTKRGSNSLDSCLLLGFTLKLHYAELEKTDGNLHMAAIADITSLTSESEMFCR